MMCRTLSFPAPPFCAIADDVKANAEPATASTMHAMTNLSFLKEEPPCVLGLRPTRDQGGPDRRGGTVLRIELSHGDGFGIAV